METLTKQQLIDEVSLRLGLSKREAKRVVELFFFHLNDTLIGGEDVRLSGFGNFTLHDKAARPGRNPKTKETVLISARRVVTFRAGNKLREIIEQTLMDSSSLLNGTAS